MAEVEVAALDGKRRRATLMTPCSVGGRVVIEGEATVMPRSRS